MIFTDLALDDTRVVWQMTHHFHTVPLAMIEAAADALVRLDAHAGGVWFVAPCRGALLLHSGAAPLGTTPEVCALAQAGTRLLPPSRLVSMIAAGNGPRLAAVLLLPANSDSDLRAASDRSALVALMGLSTTNGDTHSTLVERIWRARPIIVTRVLSRLADAGLLRAVHECALGLAAFSLAGYAPNRPDRIPGGRPESVSKPRIVA